MEENIPKQDEAEKIRRRKLLWLTLILLIGLPVYCILVAWIVGGLTAPVTDENGVIHQTYWAVELLLYSLFGLIWALPLKKLAQGLGRST